MGMVMRSNNYASVAQPVVFCPTQPRLSPSADAPPFLPVSQQTHDYTHTCLCLSSFHHTHTNTRKHTQTKTTTHTHTCLCLSLLKKTRTQAHTHTHTSLVHLIHERSHDAEGPFSFASLHESTVGYRVRLNPVVLHRLQHVEGAVRLPRLREAKATTV